ncbi:MAG: hypothetical protein MZV70_41515 [Desulfobacterales bacterium]|nr:hypothetical protein [Desulfobacterales bacterium]
MKKEKEVAYGSQSDDQTRIPKGKEKEAIAIITAAEIVGFRYPGYISGETLQNIEDPEEFLVHQHLADSWAPGTPFADPKRKALQDRIDLLQGRTTEYKIYQYPESFQLPLEEDIKFFQVAWLPG